MDRLVTVFGGSGFVGRHAVRALARAGWRVRAAVRRPDLAGHLQPLGGVGQINAVQANLRYPDSVRRAVEGAQAVVNLVGILAETGRQRFDSVQGEGAGCVAAAAAEAGVPLVHMSAIGADAESPSAYARSKAAGEAAVRAAVPGAVVLRPSVVFGPEDDFFNRFGWMARILPFLPLIGGGKTLFQPVFVGDIAQAVLTAVEGHAKPGTTYELGGPQILSMEDVLRLVLEVTGRRRLLVPWPVAIARLQATFLQYLPNPILTPDQVTLLGLPNVVSREAMEQGRTLAGLDLTPTALRAVLPSYMWRFRRNGQFAGPATA